MHKRHVILYTIRILWRADRVALCTLLVIDSFACILPLVCTKLIADIIALFSQSLLDRNAIFGVAGIYVILNLLGYVLLPIKEHFHQRFRDRVGAMSETLLYEKINSLPGIECFEDSEFYNKLLLAKDGSGMRFISITDMFSAILAGVITIGLSAYYLVQVQWLIAVIALGALLPGTVYDFWAAKNRLDLYRSRSESTRQLKYYGELFTNPAYAKEMRTLRLGEYVLEKYRVLFQTELARINRIRTRNATVGVFCTAVGAVLSGASLFMYIHKAVMQTADAGSIVLYISLLPQFVNGVRAVINGVAQTKNNNYYVQHFIDFLEMEPSGWRKPSCELTRPIRSIQFEHVSFRYPHARQYALQDVSFQVNTPSLVAIVGENGSGKSTLVKLLLNLFSAESGRILVNGTDINYFFPESYHRKLSAVFQSPARFSFTIGENVRFADIERDISDREVKESCVAADVADTVEQMPKGYESVLGKQFTDGVEVSDGQWQKISLARALCANADMLIFDEASADLDPRAEHLFYQRIRMHSRDKLTFYITHRLSGTSDADLILVMNQGKLVQIGSHRELMAQEGKYKELYTMQASGYQDGNP